MAYVHFTFEGIVEPPHGAISQPTAPCTVFLEKLAETTKSVLAIPVCLQAGNPSVGAILALLHFPAKLPYLFHKRVGAFLACHFFAWR